MVGIKFGRRPLMPLRQLSKPRWLAVGVCIGYLSVCILLIGNTALAAAFTLEESRPRAVRPRQATELTLRGAGWDSSAQAALRLWTSVPAKIEAAGPVSAQEVTFRVTPQQELLPGLIGIRLHSAGGVTNLLWLPVDDFPTVACQAAGEFAGAQTISFPAAVDGKTLALQKHYYRFHVEAGQTISVEVVAEQLGSGLDAIVVLRDAAGRELAYADDSVFGADPWLSFVCRQTGFHVLELYDVEYRGDLPFRLRVGEFPVGIVPFPAGVRLGERQRVGLRGAPHFELAPLEQVWASQPSPVVAYVPVVQQPGTPAGSTCLMTASCRQFLEQEPNQDAATATAVTLPAGINGRFATAGDVDVFTFHTTPNQWLTLRSTSAGIGSSCGWMLRVTDAQGSELVSSGDGFQRDTTLTFRSQAGGNCLLYVRNLLDSWGPSAVYHLAVAADEPPLDLRFDPAWPSMVAVPGGQAELKVVSGRRGFPGPVRLTAEWVRPGGSLLAATGEIAQDQTETTLRLALPSDARPGEMWRVRLQGDVQINGTQQRVATRPGSGPRLRQGTLGQATVAVLRRPLTWLAPEEPILAAVGGEAAVPLRLLADRKALPPADKLKVSLRLEGAPAGCQLKEQSQQFDTSQEAVDLQLTVQPEAAPGVYPAVRLVAQLDWGGRPLQLPGPSLTLKIAPPAETEPDQADESGTTQQESTTRE